MIATHRLAALAAIAAAAFVFPSCTKTVEETHDVYHHHHVYEREHTSTGPQDYGVVNQYDRMSR